MELRREMLTFAMKSFKEMHAVHPTRTCLRPATKTDPLADSCLEPLQMSTKMVTYGCSKTDLDQKQFAKCHELEGCKIFAQSVHKFLRIWGNPFRFHKTNQRQNSEIWWRRQRRFLSLVMVEPA